MFYKVYDNLFDKPNLNRFLIEMKNSPWTVDTYITEGSDDTQLDGHCQTPLNPASYIFNKINSTINENVTEVKELTLYDAHANCLFPRERAYFHCDNKSDDSITLLIYLNDTEYLEGGTELYNEDTHEVVSILPKTGRVALFSGNNLHRATCFREAQRFTVAFKYKKKHDD